MIRSKVKRGRGRCGLNGMHTRPSPLFPLPSPFRGNLTPGAIVFLHLQRSMEMRHNVLVFVPAPLKYYGKITSHEEHGRKKKTTRYKRTPPPPPTPAPASTERGKMRTNAGT